jgi:hydroxypyruvate reductase
MPKARRVFLFGLGKAACAMANACAAKMDFYDSLIITKSASSLDPKLGAAFEGNHPIPGEASLEAGRRALKFFSQLKKDDLLLCLISGGGSALMAAPIIPLDQLQALTSSLLASGARVDEINTLRRHLDLLKGGGVVGLSNGAQIVSLILSDVVGDPIEAIASGPTAPDPTTREVAAQLARRVSQQAYDFRETLKPGDPKFKRVQNHIIASNEKALQAVMAKAEREGFYTEIIQRDMQGEARQVAKDLVSHLRTAIGEHRRPLCLLAGGEATVTVIGSGKGGRNQELALAAALEMQGMKDVMLISIATDGEDGITDAAGAVATGESVSAGKMRGLDAAGLLSRNDANTFFTEVGDLIRIGSSGTNVNDVVFLIAY